jgi:hypothetical protein
METRRHRFVVAALLGVLALPATAAATVTPITPDTGSVATTLPDFSGKAWTTKKITATAPPQNPSMAPNGRSNLHNDSWMTDAYWRAGPLGKNLVQTTNNFGMSIPGLCASITFDTQGRLVAVCPSVFGSPTLRMLNATTLDQIASLVLPMREGPAAANIFQDFTGGGYFFLDKNDHPVVSTNDRKIRVYGLNTAGTSFDTLATYDLTSFLTAGTDTVAGERLSSALPDWAGNIWFVSKTNGKVGWVNTTTGAIHSITLHEEIENSFMVGSDGVYIVSDKALYRFDTAGNAVHQVWRSANYSNTGLTKPGQVNAGSGTTPTMLPGGLVAITDNADPMNVVVYKASTGVQTCKVPVFTKGGGSTENSLIGAGTATSSMLIVENNYGYVNPYYVASGGTTKPGFTRIDVTKGGKTCKVKWKNTVDSAPTVVPKLSVTNGLLYAFTKTKTTNHADAWSWTAIDASTGKKVWSKLAGVGILNFNNNYAGIHIGPNGSLFLGLIGGVATLRDGV